jgi:3-hydroxyisobutyrate dehydrogenase
MGSGEFAAQKTVRAPGVCVLGYGRLGEALTARLSEASGTVNVFSRKPVLKFASNVRFFTRASEALEGARFVLAVTSDFQSIMDVLQDIARLDGKIFLQISTLSPAQSACVEREVSARRGLYVENPVLGSRPEALAGSLIAMAGPRANIDAEVSDFVALYANKAIIFDTVGQASALKLIFNFLIGALTASFSVALTAVQDNGIPVGGFMELLRESALYAPTFDKKLSPMLKGDYGNPNFPTAHLNKDLKLFSGIAPVSPLGKDLIAAIEEIVRAAADGQDTKLDYSSLHEAVKRR